jgi:hypothetical protein
LDFLDCFSNEYSILLSHKKTIDGINPEHLKNALYMRFNGDERYNSVDKTIKNMVEPRSHADQSDNPRHLNSLLELFN